MALNQVRKLPREVGSPSLPLHQEADDQLPPHTQCVQLQVAGGPQGQHQEPGRYSRPVFRRNGNGDPAYAGETQWMQQRWVQQSLWTGGKVQMKGVWYLCSMPEMWHQGRSLQLSYCHAFSFPYKHGTRGHGSKSPRSHR